MIVQKYTAKSNTNHRIIVVNTFPVRKNAKNPKFQIGENQELAIAVQNNQFSKYISNRKLAKKQMNSDEYIVT